ncbi:secreted RxLR effector protein 161-like [Arachis stenosperma]|uniref:secreted RxLR effector protein 161-like n=1 Tax=Arachis stenosperma TaxID=217475 RepID=UPI0025AC3C73|nr:secreted RxLR effector protein 161-like [Arachis stenosperma]
MKFYTVKNLFITAGPVISDPSMYRHLIGRLIYLCFTRPDLAYSVHVLFQFMQNPRTEHWHAALRVVRYLKGHPGQGILLPKENDLQLYGWCDFDWAGYPLMCRSLTGWFIQFGTAPISWKIQKQQTVSASSAEAEYRSMAKTTRKLIWINDILSSLHVSHPASIRLYCDSQAALHIAKNSVFHKRTKHFEVDCHFIWDEIIHNRLLSSYIPTHLQLADIFTKALGTKQFGKLLVKLGIQNLHAPIWGGG